MDKTRGELRQGVPSHFRVPPLIDRFRSNRVLNIDRCLVAALMPALPIHDFEKRMKATAGEMKVKLRAEVNRSDRTRERAREKRRGRISSRGGTNIRAGKSPGKSFYPRQAADNAATITGKRCTQRATRVPA